MASRLDPDDVPVASTTAEKNEIWRECEDEARPYLVVKDMDGGQYTASYDMYTFGQNLTDGAANEAREIIEEWVDAYRDRLQDGDLEPDELTWTAGKSSSAVIGIDKEDAKMAVSELSEVVLDEDNWESVLPDFVEES